jgi:hypothetical protein
LIDDDQGQAVPIRYTCDNVLVVFCSAGAGWGGCTVSLVLEEQAPAFIAAVKKQYYQPLIAQGRLAEEEVGQFLFASKPSSGAAVLHLKLQKEPAEAAERTQTAAAPAVTA